MQLTAFSVEDIALEVRNAVVVQTDRGARIGTVVALRDRKTGTESSGKIVRVATSEDLEVEARNRVREREAFAFCVERVKALAVPMKIVAVELAHSGSTALFHFTAEDRVDFRELVKDLARRFHTRIEMRQIGVRDASRFTGGVGVCGRELCCATFLREFSPISVRMAKDQNLALNHEKLSGVCGRLKCCLCYEEPTYEALRKGLPKLGKRVLTPSGEARVKDVNALKRLVRVQFADGHYEELSGDVVKRPSDFGVTERRCDPVDERLEASEPDEVEPGEASVRDDEPADDAASGDGPAPAPQARAGADGPDAVAAAAGAKHRRRHRRRGRRGRSSGGSGQPPAAG